MEKVVPKFLLRSCFLVGLVGGGLFAKEVPVDLFAALNPVTVVDEAKAAADIIKHFRNLRDSRNQGLREILTAYISSSDSNLSESSRVLAAEVIIQLSIQENGERGFLLVTKSSSAFLQGRAAIHLIKSLNKTHPSSHYRELHFKNLNINEKKKLFELMLDQTGSVDESSMISALSKWGSTADLKLFVKFYQGSEAAQSLASRALIHIIEKRNGPIALARLAIQDDLSSKVSAVAIQRILEILSEKKSFKNIFRMLATSEKENLVYAILNSVSLNSLAFAQDKQKTLKSLLNLNRSGDLALILRNYEASTDRLRLAAEALALLKEAE